MRVYSWGELRFGAGLGYGFGAGLGGGFGAGTGLGYRTAQGGVRTGRCLSAMGMDEVVEGGRVCCDRVEGGRRQTGDAHEHDQAPRSAPHLCPTLLPTQLAPRLRAAAPVAVCRRCWRWAGCSSSHSSLPAGAQAHGQSGSQCEGLVAGGWGQGVSQRIVGTQIVVPV